MFARKGLRKMIFKTFFESPKAYILKELYLDMNKGCSYDKVLIVYDYIIKAFKTSEIRPFNEFTKILINWKDEILNSYFRPYNNIKPYNSFTKNVNIKLRTYLSLYRVISIFRCFRKRIIYSLSRNVQYALNDCLNSDSVSKRKRATYKKIRL